jgi:glycerol-3-phosphate O-acyltransferase
MDTFEEKLKVLTESKQIPAKLSLYLHKFFKSYLKATQQNGCTREESEPILHLFLAMVVDQIANPAPFAPFHERVRSPVDYYAFGLDFIRPLIRLKESRVEGKSHLNTIIQQLRKGENVILLANHQIEPDPQVISVLLEKDYPEFGEEMIFVAGHRVTTDPMAAPFSRGRNLLCIYSKRHLDTPPEEKDAKRIHNQRTMKQMVELLREGGKCIYVAPSGGRDRRGANGKVDVAKFDPSSIELFYLMAREAGRPCHFYPFAMATYGLLPPPAVVQKELGELRVAHSVPAHISFGEEVDMEDFPGSENLDRKEKRRVRAEYIWSQVHKDYQKLYEKNST